MKESELQLRIGIVIILIVFALGLVLVLELFPTNEYYHREGWMGDDSKYGFPGETVYFNYTYEIYSYDTHYDFILEIRNFTGDSWLNISYTVLSENPYENTPFFSDIRIISIMVQVPENSAEEDYSIGIRMYSQGPRGTAHYGESIRITTTDSPDLNNRPTSEEVGDNEIVYSGSAGMGRQLDFIKVYEIVVIIVVIHVVAWFVPPKIMAVSEKIDEMKRKRIMGR